MSPDRDTLGEAMDLLTPPGIEPRDWNDVVRRADSGRRRRFFAWRRVVPGVSFVGLIALLGVLLVQTGTDPTVAPATDPLRFSVFERPSVGPPPSWFANSEPLPKQSRPDVIIPSSIRTALIRGARQVAVARTEAGGYCLGLGPASKSGFQGTSTLCSDEVLVRLARGLWISTDSTHVGLVPDGVTKARIGKLETIVENNVFVLDAPPGPGGVEVLDERGWRSFGTAAQTTSLATGFSALNRPQTDRDRRSIDFSDWPGGSAVAPESIRLLGEVTTDGFARRYYGARRPDGAVCVFVDVEELAACGPVVAGEVPGWRISYLSRSGHVVVGLVPDGYSRARIIQLPSSEVAVANNLYVIETTNLNNVEVFDRTAWNHLRVDGFALLQRSQQPEDEIPQTVLDLPIEYGTLDGLNPLTVRFAGEFNGERHWVSGGAVALCLHATPDQGRCVSAEDSFNRGALVMDPRVPGDRWTRNLAGIVADGFESVLSEGGGRVPVVNNAFAFDGRPDGDRLTLLGPAGTRVIRLPVG